jgi:hypothetical protein
VKNDVSAMLVQQDDKVVNKISNVIPGWVGITAINGIESDDMSADIELEKDSTKLEETPLYH